MTVTKTTKDNVTTIVPEGMIDTVGSSAFEEAVNAVLAETSMIVIDFVKVEYISSSGLRVLLKAQKQVEAKHGEMKITNINEAIKDIFEVTGFADILTVC